MVSFKMELRGTLKTRGKTTIFKLCYDIMAMAPNTQIWQTYELDTNQT